MPFHFQYEDTMYPSTDFNQINLDWILQLAEQLKQTAESGGFDGEPGEPGTATNGIAFIEVSDTFSDITAALNDGNFPVLKYTISGNSLYMPLVSTVNNSYWFSAYYSGIFYMINWDSNNTLIVYNKEFAEKNNAVLTGQPVATTTPPPSDSSIRLANTQFVKTAISIAIQHINDVFNTVFVDSPNMLNWNTLVLNHVVNAYGVSTESNNYKHSDYISVTPGETIWFKAWVNALNYDGLQGIAFYTSNTEESFVARYTYSDGAVHSQTIPNGIYYIRVNIYKDADPQMINTGTALLPYIPYGEEIFNKNIISLPNLANTIIVEQAGKGDYTTVSDAVRNALDGDVILVMPGIYENEAVVAWGKTVHIVGVSQESCIIKNATGTYSTPPIEMGAGSLENLTVIAEEGTSTDPNGWGNYAVHVEDNNLFGKTLSIDNCNLISYNAPAVGIGLRGGSTVSIERSNLIGKTAKGGALFFHDAASSNYTGTQNINVIDCDMQSEGTSEPTLKVTSQCIVGATVNVRFLRNNVYNPNGASYEIASNNTDGTPSGGSYAGNPWRNLVNFNLTGDSYGNRKTGMNYSA